MIIFININAYFIDQQLQTLYPLLFREAGSFFSRISYQTTTVVQL